MKNKKLLFSILAVVLIFASISIFNQVLEETIDPLQKHISKATSFDVVSFKNNNGSVDITLETLETPHWTREDFIQLETRIIYDAVKHFPSQDIYTFKNITVRFVTEKTNREISQITVNRDTLMNKDWVEIENYQLENNVDSYYYKP